MDDSRRLSLAGWRGRVAAVVSGAALGILAKVADQSAIQALSDLGTWLGFWIVIVTVVSVTAPSRGSAALRAALMLSSMVVAYYTMTYVYFSVVPRLDLIVWSMAAGTAVPCLAALIWPARGDRWVAALGAAIPTGLLLAEVFMLRYRFAWHPFQVGFDLVAATVMLAALPPGGRQRVRTALLALPVAAIGWWFMSAGFGLAAGVLVRSVR